MKIHEWLAELNSHEIYNAAGCEADFRAKTGLDPCWPTNTVAQARKAIEARGVGGGVRGPDNDRVCNGWEIAEALAEKHAGYGGSFREGRGGRFFDALSALRTAGV